MHYIKNPHLERIIHMAENKTEKLRYEKKTVYEKAGSKVVAEAYDYAKGYMNFLDEAKTEREAVEYGIAMALAILVIPIVETVKFIQRKLAK